MIEPERKRVEAIFQRLVDLPPNERGAALRAESADDAVLGAAVEKLLRIHDRGLPDLTRMPLFATEGKGAAAVEASQPARIGRYEIIRKVGEGGMGIVYEARQEHPHRIVALKVIRTPAFGGLPATILHRFRHEAEILGQLQHPGIAQIHEAGVAEVSFQPSAVSSTQESRRGDHQPTPVTPRSEVPFFAMEFIRGSPIHDFAVAEQLGTRQRMELLARVCDAVHYAHQKGVIHRDLKPANILVVADDVEGLRTEDSGLSKDRLTRRPHSVLSPQHSVLASAQPKILDFGVARTTDADLQTVTMRTDMGQLIGTIPYMSPEQAAGDSLQLDARADVYALGVILYELLSGRLPHDLRQRTIPEAVRIIREEEPSRLSSVNPIFRGDIETIVSKALEKDKTRRYASAADLAADIRRYLCDEPIVARPASALYQLGKFARRNSILVGGIAGIVLVSVIGAVVAIVFALGEAEQRRLAVTKTDEAQRVAAEAAAVNTFLNQMLAPDELLKGERREIRAVELLNDAALKLDAGAFESQPGVEAAVRTTLGSSYRGMGHLDSAISQFRSALELRRMLPGGYQNDVVDSLHHLATCLWIKGEVVEAEVRLREALDVQGRLHADQPSKRAALLASLAGALYMQGRLAESESVRREALDILRAIEGENSENYLASQTSLATIVELQGRHAEAESILLDALPKLRSLLGPDDEDVVIGASALARVLMNQGAYDEAEPILRECLAIRGRVLPDDHAQVWLKYNSMSMLGEALTQQGSAALRDRGDPESAAAKFREAEPLLLDAFHNMNPPPGPVMRDRRREALQRIVRLYEVWHEAAPGGAYDTKAAEWRVRLAEWRASTQPAEP